MARALSLLTSSVTPPGRQAFRFIDQRGGEFRAPVIGADHELVEIARCIDGHEPDQRVRLFGDDDRGIRHQLAAPALAPPRHARGEIDRGIGLLPGLPPQLDRGVFVLGAIGARSVKSGRPLPFRQLQLDAAVALVGFFGRGGVERLEFGKAGGDQPLRRNAERRPDIAPPRWRAPTTIPSST